MSQGDRPRFPFSFLSELRTPQLFVLLVLLFVVDSVVLDPLPFIDEAILLILTLLTGLWRRKADVVKVDPEKPPEKNITPAG